MAVLAVIGGIDGRLRLGGQVIHEEYGEGTVTRITPKGRITVQFHEMRTCRVCLLSHLKPVQTLLDVLISSNYTYWIINSDGLSLLLFPSAACSDLQCAEPAFH